MALDTKAIDDERKALELLVQALETANDEDKALILKEIEKSAEKLDELCEALEASAALEAPEEAEEDLEVYVEIVLQAEQRARILEATGIDVPSLRLHDPDKKLTENMRQLQPSFIEERALEQAKLLKIMLEEAEEAAAAEAEAIAMAGGEEGVGEEKNP